MRISDWSSDVCSSDLFAGWRTVGRHIRAFAPQAIHISTEGPLGLAARRWCLKTGFPFTTAYHTRFPDYVAARMPVSPSLVWRFIRWFHRPARHIMVATPSLRKELADQGLEQTRTEEHTSELQSLMRISYAVLCCKNKKQYIKKKNNKRAVNK